MVRDYIVLKDDGIGTADHLTIYLRHSGDPSQTTGIMIMNEDVILIQVDAENVGRFISDLSGKWQGDKPKGLP